MLTPRARVTTRTRNSRHDPAVESLSHGADPVTPWRVANLCRRPCEYQMLSARLDSIRTTSGLAKARDLADRARRSGRHRASAGTAAEGRSGDLHPSSETSLLTNGHPFP